MRLRYRKNQTSAPHGTVNQVFFVRSRTVVTRWTDSAGLSIPADTRLSLLLLRKTTNDAKLISTVTCGVASPRWVLDCHFFPQLFQEHCFRHSDTFPRDSTEVDGERHWLEWAKSNKDQLIWLKRPLDCIITRIMVFENMNNRIDPINSGCQRKLDPFDWQTLYQSDSLWAPV